jgi:hypothetical protein
MPLSGSDGESKREGGVMADTFKPEFYKILKNLISGCYV